MPQVLRTSPRAQSTDQRSLSCLGLRVTAAQEVNRTPVVFLAQQPHARLASLVLTRPVFASPAAAVCTPYPFSASPPTECTISTIFLAMTCAV